MQIVAKSMQKSKTSVAMPDWWLKLSSENQKAYLLKHPSSKYKITKKKSKLREDVQKKKTEEELGMEEKLDAIDALKKHPDHREEIRNKIEAITEDPESVLPDDFDKIMTEEHFEKLDIEDKTEIEGHLNDAIKKKSPKSFKKAVVKTMAVLGLAVLGGALLTTGTLPYAILAAHMFKDVQGAFEDFNQTIDNGGSAVSAMMAGASKWTKNSLSSGTAVASAIILSNRASSDSEKKSNDKKDTNNKSSKVSDKEVPKKEVEERKSSSVSSKKPVEK